MYPGTRWRTTCPYYEERQDINRLRFLRIFLSHVSERTE
jgi:hypothetical protein